MRATFMTCIVIFGITLVPFFASANTPAPLYTNETYFALEHEKPAFFVGDGMGGFTGMTESNRPFFQRNILNALDVKLHRFEIDSAFFYISDRGIIYANDDVAALSIYLTRA